MTETFKSIDKDNTGLIRYNELKEILLKYNFSLNDLDKIFTKLSPEDDNGELSIRYTEFIAATIDISKNL